MQVRQDYQRPQLQHNEGIMLLYLTRIQLLEVSFNIAKIIPGKEEFHETLRYYKRQLELHKVAVKLNTKVSVGDLLTSDFDEIVIATGIKQRELKIEGIQHKNVLTYLDVLKGQKPVGKRVAIIGAGAIGFDIAEYLTHQGESTALNIDAWLQEWGIDKTLKARAGIEGEKAVLHPSPREVFMFKRSKGKFGGNLGKNNRLDSQSNFKEKESTIYRRGILHKNR